MTLERIIQVETDSLVHENNCKSDELWSWDKKKLLFETLVTPVILYGCVLDHVVIDANGLID